MVSNIPTEPPLRVQWDSNQCLIDIRVFCHLPSRANEEFPWNNEYRKIKHRKYYCLDNILLWYIQIIIRNIRDNFNLLKYGLVTIKTLISIVKK